MFVSSSVLETLPLGPLVSVEAAGDSHRGKLTNHQIIISTFTKGSVFNLQQGQRVHDSDLWKSAVISSFD